MTEESSNEFVPSILPNDANSQNTVGVLTSGGDSQGMNSAIRAVVRTVIGMGGKCYMIREGYTGLIEGNIEEAGWSSVANMTHVGGSLIGCSRCEEFRTHEGRKKAAKQMFDRKMFKLIVIGGDGSLTGILKLKEEWAEIAAELVAEKLVTEEMAAMGKELRIAGIVGSIDNDCIESDKSIGSDTALHRICESIDGLVMTAQSHRRVFVVEVMGRHCGYLALTTAIATEADYVFYPEMPPDENWPEQLCAQLETVRKLGKRQNVILVGEGVKDSKGEKIDGSVIKTEIEKRIKVEVRIATLGHLQRGGKPSFLDRLLGLRMGCDAVQEIFRTDNNGKSLTGADNEPKVMCLRGHYIARHGMAKMLTKSEAVNKEQNSGNFDLACKLRGFGFLDKQTFVNFVAYPLKVEMTQRSKVFGVVHVGSPVAGMNAATFSFTRMAQHSGMEVVGFRNGWDGLKNNDVQQLTWANVQGWAQAGGTLLGTKRQLPTELEMIAEGLNNARIDGLVIIGGFTAFHSAYIIQQNRKDYAAFNIPMIVIPATISNNCPGTCLSLGTDTALNEICRQIDNIRQGVLGSKNKVMIIETMGYRSGWIATMAALATGSDYAIIHEKQENEEDIRKIAEEAKRRFGKNRMDKFIVIRSEGASDSMPASAVKAIFDSVLKGEVGVRVTNLGYSQLGGYPSCFDRQMGIRMGIRAFEAVVNPKKMGKLDCCVIGLRGSRLKYVPVSGLERKVCMAHSVPLNMWWLSIYPFVKYLTWKPTFLAETEQSGTPAAIAMR